MVKTGFFDYLAFALQFAPAEPQEKEIRAKLARFGIEAGKKFDLAALSPEQRAAVVAGMKEGVGKIVKYLESGQKIDVWKVGSLFGDSAFYNGDWLKRAAAAQTGIYGNDAVEAMYPMTKTLANGEPLDGSKHNYTLTFPAGQFPPVNAFWSVTMYDGRSLAPDQSDRPLPDQFADAASHEEECGRFADALHPERFPRQGQGI